VAVLKGVVADSTPHCGGAVLTEDGSERAVAGQIESDSLAVPTMCGYGVQVECAAEGARGKALAPRELDFPGAFFVVRRKVQMSDEWTADRKRVLVAEDETIIRIDLCGLLEEAGMEVCAAARNGEEAVELARSTRPDLALMDVRMPRLDGIEAARRILEERPLPIVMLTAHGDEELVTRAVGLGVFGYLVKPFREQDLLPAIHTALARHSDLTSSRRSNRPKIDIFIPAAAGTGGWPLTVAHRLDGSADVSLRDPHAGDDAQ
jgi:CheY-like chemotaxis protein